LQKIADYNIEMLNNSLTEQVKRRDSINECSLSDDEEKTEWRPKKLSPDFDSDFESSSSSSDSDTFDPHNRRNKKSLNLITMSN